MITNVHPLLTWQICQIGGLFFQKQIAYIFNQSRSHWLLSDALYFIVLMNLNLKEENQIVPSFESLMGKNSIIVDELVLLVSNIRKEFCGVLHYFLSFLMKYDNKKAHNMNFFMLEPRIKNLQIVSSFVGQEQGVKKYDRKTLYPMLVKCYEHLHPLIRPKRS
jgi:hypothetical protein